MDKTSLHTIQKIFSQGGNIIQALKGASSEKNTKEMIAISYDFQSGSYIKYTEENAAFNAQYTTAIAELFSNLPQKFSSILEVGVGEATTLANVITKLRNIPSSIYGFDISWSRIRYAQNYIQKKKVSSAFLFVADLFCIPLADNSIDLVYTSHSIEPNGGREEEALKELLRITRKYLVLLEPAYELASKAAQKRMREHGYVRHLHKTAQQLGCKVLDYRLFDVFANELNPTGVLILEKVHASTAENKSSLICPITKTKLELLRGSYFSRHSLLVYPVIDTVPCLLRENAIIATHFEDTF